MSRRESSLLLFHVGFAVLVCQALFAREFLVLFHGNEIAIGVFFAAWVGWLGAGAALAGVVARDKSEVGVALWLLFLALAPAAMGELELLRHAREWIGAAQGEIAPLGSLALAVSIATAPLGLLAGLLFPLSCRAVSFESREGAIGRLYGYEALGSCVGGLVFTFWWAGIARAIPILFVLAGLSGAHVLFVALRDSIKRFHAVAGGTLLALALIGAVIGLPSQWSDASRLARFKTLQPDLELLDEADTRYQHAAVARRGEQIVFLSNGKIVASAPDERANDQRAAFAVAQRSDARRVLLVGGGVEGLAQAFLRYDGLERVTVLEQDATFAGLVRRHLPKSLQDRFDDSRLEVVAEDARRAVTNGSLGAFDLAVINLPDPSTAYLNRAYTHEFFADLRECVGPDGVVIASVTSAEHVLGEDVLGYGASVFATMRSVFEEVVIAPGDVNTLAASDNAERVSVDWQELARRYATIAPSDSTFPAEAFASMLEPERVTFARDRFTNAVAPINSDARPSTYYLNMILWGRFAGSNVSAFLKTSQRAGLAALLAPLIVALFLLLARGRKKGASSLRAASLVAVLVAGLFAMAADLALLFAYQSAFGFVYERIGLVVAALMLGLAAGSLAVSRWSSARSTRMLCSSLVALTAFAVLLISGLSFLPSFTSTAPAAAEIAFMALFFLTGAFSGGVFAAASRSRQASSMTRNAAALDAMDHIGGALGALATGAFFVPMLGVVETAIFLASFCGFALAVCLMATIGGRRRDDGWAWVLAWIAVSVYAVMLLSREPERREDFTIGANVLSDLTGRRVFERLERPFGHYRVVDAPSPEAVVSSRETAPDARGWGGAVPLLIDLDAQSIRNVRLGSHNETPSYVEGIDEWLAQFRAAPIDNGFHLGDNIDAMTGATVTSQAVVDAMNRSAYLAGARLFGRDLNASKFDSLTWRAALLAPRNLLLVGCFVLLVPVYLRPRRWTRYVLQGAAFVILGVATNQVLTLADIARLSIEPSFTPATASLTALVTLVAISGLLFGAAFCGYLCPFGAAQEFASLIGKRLGFNTPITHGMARDARRLRYGLLVAGLVGFWLSSGNRAFVSFSPMQFVFSGKASLLVWLLAALIAIACLRHFRFWCRAFCPAGAALALFNHVGLLDRFLRRRRAASCDVGMASAQDVDCLRCNRCVEGMDSARARPGGARSLVAFTVVTLLLIGAIIVSDLRRDASQSVDSGSVVEGAYRGRDVDRARLDRALQSGQIVEHEALYYRRLEDDDTRAGQRSGADD